MSKNFTVQQIIDKLNEDTSFSEKVSECESLEEIVATFQEAGYEITTNDLGKILQMAAVENCNGELKDEALENVSGGILMSTLCGIALGAFFIEEAARLGRMLLR